MHIATGKLHRGIDGKSKELDQHFDPCIVGGMLAQ